MWYGNLKKVLMSWNTGDKKPYEDLLFDIVCLITLKSEIFSIINTNMWCGKKVWMIQPSEDLLFKPVRHSFRTHLNEQHLKQDFFLILGRLG